MLEFPSWLCLVTDVTKHMWSLEVHDLVFALPLAILRRKQRAGLCPAGLEPAVISWSPARGCCVKGMGACVVSLYACWLVGLLILLYFHFKGESPPWTRAGVLLWSLPLHMPLSVWSLHLDALGMASFSIFLLCDRLKLLQLPILITGWWKLPLSEYT